jgi:hypothetical protein
MSTNGVLNDLFTSINAYRRAMGLVPMSRNGDWPHVENIIHELCVQELVQPEE